MVVVLVVVVVVLDVVGVISGVAVGFTVVIGVIVGTGRIVGSGGNDGEGNGMGEGSDVGKGVIAGVGVLTASLSMEMVVFLLFFDLFPAFAFTLIRAFEFNFAFLGIVSVQLIVVCSSPPKFCFFNFTNHFFPRFPFFDFFTPIISPLTETDLFPSGVISACTVIFVPGEKVAFSFPSVSLVQTCLIEILFANTG